MDLKSIAYGLAAHLLLGWALLVFLPQKSDRPKPPPIPVKITFDEKEKPTLPLSTDAPKRGTRPSRTEAQPKPKSASTPTEYTDLIPKATTGQISIPVAPVPREAPLVEGHQFKEGTSGVTRQKLVIDASSLSAALDVPLQSRRHSAGMEAFVRLDRRDPDGLRIIDLRGDPMLRAVIFENLQDPKIVRLIRQLMDELEETSLPLTLQAIPGAQGDRMQEELDFSWIGRKLVIRKTAPPQSRAAGGGITLPDEDAKKAIIRDRLEFERYQRSPAYRSALQNYDVPAPR